MSNRILVTARVPARMIKELDWRADSHNVTRSDMARVLLADVAHLGFSWMDTVQRLGLRLRPDALQWIDDQASEHELSRSEALRQMLWAGLERHNSAAAAGECPQCRTETAGAGQAWTPGDPL